MRVVECEQGAVKEETAPTTVKKRDASAAGNEESSGEPHVERQQSEHREEATAMTSAVKEEDNAEELNVEESSVHVGCNDNFLQSTNDGTGDDGNGSPVRVRAATTTEIPTSEVLGGKGRSCEAASSTHHVRVQTRSKKRAKLPHSTVHETSEVAGTTVHPHVVRRSVTRATAKAHDETFDTETRRCRFQVEPPALST